jgi:hypothetical protein
LPADQILVTTSDDLIDRELMLNRFKRLMGELLRGQFSRQSFEPWEVDILIDLDECQLDSRRRMDILKQYQRAVERQLDVSDGPPMKLSQFLIERSRKI